MVDKKLKVTLEKEINRKEFLQYAGAAILSLFGIAGIIRALLYRKTTGSTTSQIRLFGYGSGAYGGDKKGLL